MLNSYKFIERNFPLDSATIFHTRSLSFRTSLFQKKKTIGRRVKCNFRAACFKDAYIHVGRNRVSPSPPLY